MKRKYCINIDQSIAYATFAPLVWSIFLLVFFLFALWIEGSKDIATFWQDIGNGWKLWFYLSGPISLVAAAFVSAFFIAFPVSYIEVEKEIIRIHRAFKKDKIIPLDNICYIRQNRQILRRWPIIHLLVMEEVGINTIEIRVDHPLSSFWLSSSKKVYKALSSIMRTTSAGKREMIEEDGFIADANWVTDNGNPNGIEWRGLPKD